MPTVYELSDFFERYTTEIAVLAGFSVLLFFLALFGLPLIIIAMPANYFVRPKKHRLDRYGHPVVTAILLAAKNILGLVFIVIGIVLLFMPGQGLLAIFAGIMLLNFPGKHRLELAIICRPSIRRVIGWIRSRAKKPPLILPDECCQEDSHDCE
jgi:archaellum biogenesis protein FlaJ (TadC family)